MPYSLRLLGSPKLEFEGEYHSLALDKPTSLLCYLAAREGWVTRAELAFLYKPDDDEETARQHLRVLLHRAKKIKSAEGIVAERRRLKLDIATDVRQFKKAVKEQLWQKALKLYKGTFLQGLSLLDTPGYDAWLEMERSDLQELWRQAVLAYTDELLLNQEFDEALSLITELREFDPLSEEALQAHLTILQRQGRRELALDSYEQFRLLLKQELDLEPFETTRALVKNIRNPTVKFESKQTATGTHMQQTKSNLPQASSRFVGRKREIAELEAYLADKAKRLITLKGLGGMGKTRLALELARNQKDAYKESVYFVPLASVQQSSHVALAICSSLGIVLTGKEEAKRQLIAFLADKKILLVLDNFEHVHEATVLLAELLQTSSELTLLVTSRSALGLSSEWLFELKGLQVPKTLEDLKSDAATLFIQTAQQSHKAFQAHDKKSIHQICRLVEGMPLALELAASWVSILDCKSILSELRQSLDLLDAELIDKPDRHQNMRAAFMYSWQRLPAKEQTVLLKLSLFITDFSLDAAREVAETHLPMLLRLNKKSLLRRNDSGRFELHELLKQFLAEQRTYALEQETLSKQSAYYLKELVSFELALKGRSQAQTLNAIMLDLPNIEIAIQQASKKPSTTFCKALEVLYLYYDMKGLAEQALGIYTDLLAVTHKDSQAMMTIYQAWFKYQLGQVEEAQSQILAHQEQLTSSIQQGISCFFLGYIQDLLGNYSSAEQQLKEARALFEIHEESFYLARVLNMLGNVHLALTGERDKAMGFHDEALKIAERGCDQSTIIRCLNNMGAGYYEQGAYQEAQSHFERALENARALGDKRQEGMALNNLGVVTEELGSLDTAKIYIQESLSLRQRIGDRKGEAYCLSNLADIASSQHDYPQALIYLEASKTIRQGIQDQRGVVDALTGIANLQLKQGYTLEAKRVAREALSLVQAIENKSLKLSLLHLWSSILKASNDYEQALNINQFVLRKSKHVPDYIKKEAEWLNQTLKGDYPKHTKTEQSLDTLIASLIGAV